MEDLRRQANDLLVFYGKMQNRLSQAGVEDPAALVVLFNQLQRGLESIDSQELDPAIAEVERLIDGLGRMQADLRILRELKQRVGTSEGDSAEVNGSENADGVTTPKTVKVAKTVPSPEAKRKVVEAQPNRRRPQRGGPYVVQ